MTIKAILFDMDGALIASPDQSPAAARAYPPDRTKVYLLSALHNAGVRIGVYSNAIYDTVRAFLYASCLQPFVDSVVSGEATRPKPDPAGYLQLMAFFGVEPHETLIVEDSAVGLEAAYRTGAHVLEVAGPHEVTFARIRDALERAGGSPGDL